MRFSATHAICLAIISALLTPVLGGDQQTNSSQIQTQTQAAFNSEYEKLDKMLRRIRERNTHQFAIHSKNGIDEASYVPIGGIEQWITIRGEDRANPVLLIIHGGPGDVTNPWSFALFASWQKYFTIVQWDERGSGRTFKKTGPSIGPTMTLDRMAKDGIELAEYLRAHLQKNKVIVLAHSFGCVLGLRMISARPDLFYAYVGTGEVADATKNYTFTYYALLKKAQATGNLEAFDDLHRAGPPPYKSGEGYRVQWKWANRFERADGFLYGTIGLALVAPGYSAEDLADDEEGEMLSGEQIVPQLTSATTPKNLGLNFSIPIFFLQGAEDFTTSTELARNYLAIIHAPKKEFIPIEGGGHFSVFMKSDQFLGLLLKHVRPLATVTH